MSHATLEPDRTSTQHRQDYLLARHVLRAEAEAIGSIVIDRAFHQAVDLILGASGSLVVTGLGKSGLIGQKISATLASTGTMSHVVHPTEALHGDLGRLRRQDVVLALSYSGNTDEVVALVTILRQDEVPVIAMVGRPDCHLGRLATVTLAIGDVTEACPMNLAPTASATAMLALGDALALCVSRRRQFGLKDFRKVHPGGALGRQLMPVADAMRFRAGDNLPLLDQDLPVQQAFARAEQQGKRRAGALILVDEAGRLTGLFTDADFRRLVLCGGAAALDRPIRSVMTVDPHRLQQDALLRDAVQMVRELRIDEIPVVDDQDRPVGLIDVQDLMALKLIEG